MSDSGKLIAKGAHVRLKDTLRVLLALRAGSNECEMAVESIIGGKYCALKATTKEAVQCRWDYTWMYESPEIGMLLFEIEQLQ
jgi:hypothetical protein